MPIRDPPRREATIVPTVSVIIIAFHNEERWVDQKIKNTLAWNYPADVSRSSPCRMDRPAASLICCDSMFGA
jgi:hypothetical protein